MRKEVAVVAVVVASLACGGGEAVSDKVEEAAGNELAEKIIESTGNVKDAELTNDGLKVATMDGGSISAGSGTALPGSWPSSVPNYGAPMFAGETPGAVPGKNDLTAMWTVPDSLQQVADKYAAVEGSGWKRMMVSTQSDMYMGSWTSADGKQTLTIMASPDTTSGKTSVSAVIANTP